MVMLRRSAQLLKENFIFFFRSSPVSPGLRFLSYFIGFGAYEMDHLEPLMFGDRFWTLIDAKFVMLCNW
jgi:hypothetical protein